MSRFRLPLLILGLVGAVVVMIAVVVVVRLGRGTPVELPVAVADITPGTPLEPAMFRLQEVRGMDAGTLAAYVTAAEFAPYVGLPSYEMIHAGAPVLKAQLPDPNDPETANWRQSHLTLLLSDESHLVYPLPVTAEQVGDHIVAGDRVDVIFTLGRVAAQDIAHVEELDEPPIPRSTGAISPTGRTLPPARRAGAVITTTFHLPVAKVILADVPVLRVERERVRTAAASYGLSGEDPQPVVVEGEIVRLYLEVDREQAEILSFALHNGALNLPARAVPAEGTSEGFTWDDFEQLFFEGRPDE
jgi:Flp pilus assembly protein CpaB